MDLEAQLLCEKIPFVKNESLSRHTTFGIGGPARFFATPTDATQLERLLSLAQLASTPYFVLGRGSNVLADDAGFDGIVITTKRMRQIRCEGEIICADCGAHLNALAMCAAEHSLTGLEFAHGIPGTLGGGVRMNAGAYGGEIATVFESAQCYDSRQNETVMLDREQMRFAYRHSLLSTARELTLLCATLHLKNGNEAEIRATMQDYSRRRRSSQPLEYPSAGSVFKRPEGHFAGKLIEDCGLKGTTIGGAQISEKHAGFIVNRGSATAADVRELIQLIQCTVKERLGVSLETEVLFLNESTCGCI